MDGIEVRGAHLDDCRSRLLDFRYRRLKFQRRTLTAELLLNLAYSCPRVRRQNGYLSLVELPGVTVSNIYQLLSNIYSSARLYPMMCG